LNRLAQQARHVACGPGAFEQYLEQEAIALGVWQTAAEVGADGHSRQVENQRLEGVHQAAEASGRAVLAGEGLVGDDDGGWIGVDDPVFQDAAGQRHWRLLRLPHRWSGDCRGVPAQLLDEAAGERRESSLVQPRSQGGQAGSNVVE
jgi:hypothetical protein